ncbi:MAG: PEP-CTERM sorting domain-containing protein [Chthoniobacterales bacterium]|nr:PEP-CTERM sorting domain-containing protein [Chthoniobacterales bacterium]
MISDTGTYSGNPPSSTFTIHTFGDIVNTDSAVFVFFASDANALNSATYGGTAMTVVTPTNGRVALAYLINPADNGALILNAGLGSASLEIGYWGVASGINTGAIKTAAGTSFDLPSDLQINTTLPNLVNGDVVFSGFAINGDGANGNVYGAPAGLISYDGDASGFDAIIRRYDMAADGGFSPTTAFTGVNTPNPAGASIAFTAVPEPSTCAAVFLGSLALLAVSRRRVATRFL